MLSFVYEPGLTFLSILRINPSSRNSATVALIFLKQISKVSLNNSESLVYFMAKYSFDFRYLNGGVKPFVKTPIAAENPLGRTIYF